jgi:hypothetical protein
MPTGSSWFTLTTSLTDLVCYSTTQIDRTVRNLGIMNKTSSTTYEGFHEWGYPNSWMVCMEKPSMDDLEVPPHGLETSETSTLETCFYHFLSLYPYSPYELLAGHGVTELRQVFGAREGVEVSDC